MEPTIHFLYFRICYKNDRPDTSVLVNNRKNNDVVWIFKRMFESKVLNNDVEVVVINGTIWKLIEIYEVLSKGKNISREILSRLYKHPFVLSGKERPILTEKPSYEKINSSRLISDLEFKKGEVSSVLQKMFDNLKESANDSEDSYIVALLDSRDLDKGVAAIEVDSSKEIMFAARDIITNVLPIKDYVSLLNGEDLDSYIIVWRKKYEGDELQIISSRFFRMIIEDLNHTIFLDGNFTNLLYLLAKILKNYKNSYHGQFERLYDFLNFRVSVIIASRLISLEDYFDFVGSLMAFFAGLDVEEDEIEELKELIVTLLGITSSVSDLLEKESRMKNLCMLI